MTIKSVLYDAEIIDLVSSNNANTMAQRTVLPNAVNPWPVFEIEIHCCFCLFEMHEFKIFKDGFFLDTHFHKMSDIFFPCATEQKLIFAIFQMIYK